MFTATRTETLPSYGPPSSLSGWAFEKYAFHHACETKREGDTGNVWDRPVTQKTVQLAPERRRGTLVDAGWTLSRLHTI